jgi:hypothetical protein
MPSTPFTITVPAFKVNPPVYAPPAVARVPSPVLIIPVPAAVDVACVPKSRRDPVPMFRVLTAPPVPKVPPAPEKVTVAPLAKVIFPTLTIVLEAEAAVNV